MTFDDPSLLNVLFVTSTLSMRCGWFSPNQPSLTNYARSDPQKPYSRKWRSFRVPFSFLGVFLISEPHAAMLRGGLGSGITISTRLGLRFVASVSAKARDMLTSRKSKISTPILNSGARDTKLVVNETRISEAKVTIRELFEGINDWIPGFPYEARKCGDAFG